MVKKAVICSKKSKQIAIPAYKENDRTAGIGERAPKKKQVASESDVRSIDGITSPAIRPIRDSKFSSFTNQSRWNDKKMFFHEPISLKS